jgi:hypothetical protein
MVVDYIGDYKGTNLSKIWIGSCEWRSLLEWTSCKSIIVWKLYIWSI